MYFTAMRQASTRRPEAIARCRGSDYRHGRFGVAAEERLQQIGLLGFRRQAGGRAAALDVANHERHFDHDGESDGFGFQRHAGAGSCGDRQRAAVSSADRRSYRGDFVFRLKCRDAEIFVLRELMQNVGSRA